MERAKHYFLYVMAGAAAYWIPDIAVQWIRPPDSIRIALLTTLVPAIALTACYVLSTRPAHARFRVGLPFFMLLGIWMFGPLCIAIGMLPAGGKFLDPDRLGDFFVLWAWFPLSTLILSTYSGSLDGVCVLTLALALLVAIAIVRSIASRREWTRTVSGR